MALEWDKQAVAELIKAYKDNENLYNSKQKLYYNKQARNLSLERILKAVQKKRPETTLGDITKKIQTLRTQFGQEIGKIEKSQALGEDLIYKPKIWWFAHLDWIGNFMKTRTGSTLLSSKVHQAKLRDKRAAIKVDDVFSDEADDPENVNEAEFEFEYDTEVQEQDPFTQPSAKKQRTYLSPKVVRTHKEESSENIQTIQYTLINEDSNEVIQTSNSQNSSSFLELDAQADPKLQNKCKRRSKTFGKYIAALLTEITDDRIFFDLQRNITNAINEANTKQLNLGKS